MRATSIVFMLALGSTSASAGDGWKNLNGKPVPALEATGWLNCPEQNVSPATLKGKVWLLVFFGTS